MRMRIVAVFLCGCGGLLPFGRDDDEDPPPPPPAVSADASSTDAAGDASDAAALRLVWSCTTDPPSPAFPTEDECNGARLREICNPTAEPPIDLPCETFGGNDGYCEQTCQKSGPGASTYVYTTTHCTCARQP